MKVINHNNNRQNTGLVKPCLNWVFNLSSITAWTVYKLSVYSFNKFYTSGPLAAAVFGCSECAQAYLSPQFAEVVLVLISFKLAFTQVFFTAVTA